MLYQVEALKADIRIALDQNMTSDQLFDTGDIDTLSLEDIIESKIADAARIVENGAPRHLLEGGKNFGDSISWDSAVGYGSGRILLPDDFMRLVSFQMSDWSRPCTVAITEDDPLYAAQSSRFPGVRGNPQKPVVAVSMQPAGAVLEFFSCTQGPTVYVKRATYLPYPKIEDGYIDLCPKLHRAVIYYAAHLVAAATGDTNGATALLNISNELMK